jgi:colicin import membrane protein
MTDFLKQNWKYLLGAALLHVLFAGIFGLTMISMARNAPPPVLAIQAVTVDPSQLLGAGSARREKQEQARKEAVERERLAEEQRQKQAKEQEQKKATEQQAQREAEQRAEQERQVELKQRQEQEQQRVHEEQQLREKQEADRKRAEDAQRQQAEAERQRVADIERKQKEEAQRRKAAEDAKLQSARENELKRQLEDEEGRTQAENAGLLNQYIGLIQQQIVRNWNRPPSARSGLECQVKVAQTPAGVVLSVQVVACNGDAAVKQSIEAAVMRSSPLPPPPDPRLYERNLLFVFKPAD